MVRLPVLALALLLTAAVAPTSRGPVEFRSDRLDARRSEGLVILEGDVVVTHLDARLAADRMTLHYGPDGKTVERIIAAGRVRYDAPGRRARAANAVYEPATRRLVLTGAPRIWEGNDVLAGSRIEILREPNRLLVHEARASLQPERLQAAIGAQAPQSAATEPTP